MQKISLENNQHLTWKMVFGVQIVAELLRVGEAPSQNIRET